MIKVLVLVGLVAIDESSEHNANKIEIIIELSEECISFSSIHPCKASIKSWWRMISNWGLESRGNWFIITITQLPQEIREGSSNTGNWGKTTINPAGKINSWLSRAWDPQIYWNLCQYNVSPIRQKWLHSKICFDKPKAPWWSIKLIPVVHEDVWCPDGGGREPEILHVPVLWLIPPKVVVYPLLKVIIRVMIHS